MSNRTNDVTLFSNGIGHFRRVYKVPASKEETFSIPFKRDHIGDVAASLQVFGKVRLTKPPSFTPMNANATALHINQSEAYRSLVRNLSGAAVSVEFTDGQKGSYTLLGLDSQETTVQDTIVTQDYVVLMKGGKVIRRGLCEVKRVEAEGIQKFQEIVTKGIDDRLLRWKGIDATLKLAESHNTKIIIIGSGRDGLPVLLGSDGEVHMQAQPKK